MLQFCPTPRQEQGKWTEAWAFMEVRSSGGQLGARGPWLPHTINTGHPPEDLPMTPAAGQKPGLPWTGWLGTRGGYAPNDPVWRASLGGEKAGHDSPLFCIDKENEAR